MAMKFGECGHPQARNPARSSGFWCRVCWLVGIERIDVIDDDNDVEYSGQAAMVRAEAQSRYENEEQEQVENAYDFPVIDEDFGGAATHPDAFRVTCLADAMIIENIIRYRTRHAIDLDTVDAWERRRGAVDLMIGSGLMRPIQTMIVGNKPGRAEWVRIPWEHLDRSYIPPEVVEANPARRRVNVEPFTGIHGGTDYERGVPVAIVQQRLNEAMSKRGFAPSGAHYSMGGHPVDD